jgi:thioredoxin 1
MATDSRHQLLVELDEKNFEALVSSGKNVLVDFWAEWCSPCKMIEPILEKLAKKYEGRVVFGRVNVDKEMNLSSRFQILSIPTFILFRNGLPMNTMIGAVGEETLEHFIVRSLNGSI